MMFTFQFVLNILEEFFSPVRGGGIRQSEATTKAVTNQNGCWKRWPWQPMWLLTASIVALPSGILPNSEQGFLLNYQESVEN